MRGMWRGLRDAGSECAGVGGVLWNRGSFLPAGFCRVVGAYAGVGTFDWRLIYRRYGWFGIESLGSEMGVCVLVVV